MALTREDVNLTLTTGKMEFFLNHDYTRSVDSVACEYSKAEDYIIEQFKSRFKNYPFLKLIIDEIDFCCFRITTSDVATGDKIAMINGVNWLVRKMQSLGFEFTKYSD